MTTNSAVEIGNHLVRLRDKAGLSQKDLAQKVTWSPAVLSRVESGERLASSDELTSILKAIGTTEALEFSETANRAWRYIEKPPLGHPDEPILWQAERVLADLQDLQENPDIRQAFATRLNEYVKELDGAAYNVAQTEYSIAFVGDIGVGKTTALCRISDLEVRKNAVVIPTPVLECGVGRTTVCEVNVVRGPDYGIIVEPRDVNEIDREVLEFSKYLLPSQGADPDNELDGQDFSGTSREIERAIRNMSNLVQERRRKPDGKWERIDPARDLASESADSKDLAAKILTRMKLPNRTRREIWFSDISGKEPLPWLEEIFRQVNNGRHPEFSLPKRIEVLVPHRILGENFLNIRLVDTKGIDGIAERADLEVHFDAPNTIVILCSSFNDAPSLSAQHLLSRSQAGGVRDLDIKAAVLVLPHPNQALAVKDDLGDLADTVADGYDLKREQAETQLDKKRISYAKVEFFNAHEDNPQLLTDFLLGMVNGLRDKHRETLAVVIKGASDLVQNYEQEQTSVVQQQAAHHLTTWLDNNGELGTSTRGLGDALLEAIKDAHPSSLRASVNRQGEWHNLDYPHQLASGARFMAFRAIRSKGEAFREVSKTTLANPDLAEARPLVEQALRIFEEGTQALLRNIQVFGRTIYTHDLKPDSTLWAICKEEWGQGPRYRDRVHRHQEGWFNRDARKIDRRAEALIEREWREVLKRVSSVLQVD